MKVRRKSCGENDATLACRVRLRRCTASPAQTSPLCPACYLIDGDKQRPRDGVAILGGEAFLQPVGLAVLLCRLKARSVHTTVYTGYTLEALGMRPEPAVRAALELTDLLIDGPFVAALAHGGGEWRGSRNQRLIAHPSTLLSCTPGSAATP